MRHWTDIGFSSIYYVLKRLERRTLVISFCEHQQDKPARKVYTITSEGKRMMKEKVRFLLSTNPRIASPFDLGIVHLPLLSKEENIACLKERVRALDRAIDQINSHHDRHIRSGKPYFVCAISDRVLAHLTTEKRWVEQFITEVDQHVLT
jgi:DNA-binding PadR family transcriptional regulator